MKTAQKNSPSKPFTSLSIAPSPSAQEQAQDFAAFADASNALRTHLHGCWPVAQHILELARACASGDTGTKNDAKKYFEPGSLTAAKLRACELAPDCDAFSKALYDLSGKPALYEVGSRIARSATGENTEYRAGKLLFPAHFCLDELERLESIYIAKRNHIVQRNLRLAASVANTFNKQTMSVDDLVQHASIGLQKAVESFKPSKGNQFSTYAVPVIRGELVRACENSSHQVRLPSHVWGKMRKYNDAREKLTAILARKPTCGELAQELGITLSEEAQLRQHHWEPVSLSCPLGEGHDAMTLGEILLDDRAQRPGFEPSEYADFIAPHCENLDFMERTILRKYVGDGPCQQMEKEDIATALGLTLAEVSRILMRGLQKVMAHKESASLAA